jgi:transcriptional regulator with XRE-family HTH domain
MADLKIGIALRKARRSRALTLRQLSERTGLRIQHISRLERCEHLPTVQTLVRMAEALNYPAGRILDLGCKLKQIEEGVANAS